jgi:DNA-binding HxlR family transcriptional regulator
MRAVPATFRDQLGVIEELLSEVERMELGERRASPQRRADAYERELRLAGLAQRIAQAYTIMEGVLDFVARRIDRDPVAGEDWHKKLIERCSRPIERPARPAVLSGPLAEDLRELCEFRHVVRNIYPTRLDEARVKDNLTRLINAARAFSEECRAFAVRPAPKSRTRRERRTAR